MNVLPSPNRHLYRVERRFLAEGIDPILPLFVAGQLRILTEEVRTRDVGKGDDLNTRPPMVEFVSFSADT